ncbi:hypothetical protein ACFWHR_03565 [Leucobacter sp. NPDC058333]|uniref:hypothetical protein n=1 Tax=Leucobacter sp. NPDC058333 TaxID=3346450 RepID=UPI00365399C3
MYTGTHTYPQQSPTPWRMLFWGINGGIVLILGLRSIMALWLDRSWLVFVVFVAILVIANAVLVPLLVTKLRKKIVIDFDRGTIGSERTGPFLPAEFVMIVDNFRTWPQAAHSLEFQFQRGAVGIEAGAFTQSPLLRQRNEAMIAYMTTWLNAPQQHRSVLGPGGPGITRYAVGKDEATQILCLP